MKVEPSVSVTSWVKVYGRFGRRMRVALRLGVEEKALLTVKYASCLDLMDIRRLEADIDSDIVSCLDQGALAKVRRCVSTSADFKVLASIEPTSFCRSRTVISSPGPQ